MANPSKSEGSADQQAAKEENGAAVGAEGEATDASGKQRLEGKVDLALLNEDDDFEEFPAEEWDDVDPNTQTNKVSPDSFSAIDFLTSLHQVTMTWF